MAGAFQARRETPKHRVSCSTAWWGARRGVRVLLPLPTPAAVRRPDSLSNPPSVTQPVSVWAASEPREGYPPGCPGHFRARGPPCSPGPVPREARSSETPLSAGGLLPQDLGVGSFPSPLWVCFDVNGPALCRMRAGPPAPGPGELRGQVKSGRRCGHMCSRAGLGEFENRTLASQ